MAAVEAADRKCRVASPEDCEDRNLTGCLRRPRRFRRQQLLHTFTRSGFLTSAAAKCAAIFQIVDVSRKQPVDTLRARAGLRIVRGPFQGAADENL